jgi:excisionase family DNA binding protein
MSDDQARPDWLTVEAAARRLGVSASTVKRRIQDGKPIRTAFGSSVEFDREMVERPQGHEWLVRFRSALPPISTDHERAVSESTPAVSSAQEPPAALMTALETIREQSARIASLEREAGRLEGQVIAAHAERDAARQAAEAARAELERERRRSWWDRLIGRYPN